MKRTEYKIRIDGQVVGVRFAWNSALNGVRAIIRDIAQKQAQDYSLVEKSYVKEGIRHVSGRQVWHGSKGHTVTVTISTGE